MNKDLDYNEAYICYRRAFDILVESDVFKPDEKVPEKYVELAAVCAKLVLTTFIEKNELEVNWEPPTENHASH